MMYGYVRDCIFSNTPEYTPCSDHGRNSNAIAHCHTVRQRGGQCSKLLLRAPHQRRSQNIHTHISHHITSHCTVFHNGIWYYFSLLHLVIRIATLRCFYYGKFRFFAPFSASFYIFRFCLNFVDCNTHIFGNEWIQSILCIPRIFTMWKKQPKCKYRRCLHI